MIVYMALTNNVKLGDIWVYKSPNLVRLYVPVIRVLNNNS